MSLCKHQSSSQQFAGSTIGAAKPSGLIKWSATFAALLLGACCCVAAHATVISYAANSLGGQLWRYDYIVENDSTVATIDELTIFFDYGLFSDLVVAGTPAGWDSLVAEPITALSSDGFLDSLALATGLAPGESLTGLSVTFSYSGIGVPGSQLFDVVDPQRFVVLQSGRTISAVANTVPEPSAILLLLTAGALAALVTGLGVGKR